MTLSADMNAEDGNDKTPAVGTSIMPVDGTRGIDPFLATAETPTAAARPWHSRLLDYSAHAAMIVGLIGFAWTVSDHVVTHETAAQIEAPDVKAAEVKFAEPKAAEIKTAVLAAPVAPAAPVDEIGDLRHANQKMAADIKALHASLDALRGTVAKDRTPDQLRALTAGLDDVKAGLNNTKSETTAKIAQLSGKVEALRQPPPKLQQTADMAPTSSIPPETKMVPKPPVKPSNLVSADDSISSKPQIVAGWVVRDVYDGVAVIEGKRGQMEVVPGVSIPGAGVVKSIDRHGAGWTVTTSKGQLAYAAMPRDYRRAQARDYYPAYRYDF